MTGLREKSASWRGRMTDVKNQRNEAAEARSSGVGCARQNLAVGGGASWEARLIRARWELKLREDCKMPQSQRGLKRVLSTRWPPRRKSEPLGADELIKRRLSERRQVKENLSARERVEKDAREHSIFWGPTQWGVA